MDEPHPAQSSPRESHPSISSPARPSDPGPPRPRFPVRRILRIERSLRSYRPTFRPPPGEAPPPPRPDAADRALEALAAAHRPGEPVTVEHLCVAAGLSRPAAMAVRRWARAAGLWPYADPPGGFQLYRLAWGRGRPKAVAHE